MNDLVDTKETALDRRDSIHDLEAALFSLPGELRLDPESLVNHHFAPGVYAREMIIPAGHCLTGKIHKTEHLNIVSSGKIAVSSEDGRKIIQAPAIFSSKPGTKRAGYAFEDTVWITIHVTDETDLGKIEDQVIAKDYSELGLDEKPMLENDV